jgi:hypothetical protein
VVPLVISLIVSVDLPARAFASRPGYAYILADHPRGKESPSKALVSVVGNVVMLIYTT